MLLSAFGIFGKAGNKMIRPRISILGDSYSSYEGWLPAGYHTWYFDGQSELTTDVNDVRQTWWWQLCQEEEMVLLRNSSYSGSTICNTGYDDNAAEFSFITRMKEDLGEKNVLNSKPDILFVFGGTNDSWAGSPVGEVKYADWTKEELYSFAPAFCYMMDYLTKWNPGTKIYHITNMETTPAIQMVIAEACEHYGIENIILEPLDLQNGHPTRKGMRQIKNQVVQYLYK